MMGGKKDVERKEEKERTGKLLKRIAVNVEDKALARSIQHQARHISR